MALLLRLPASGLRHAYGWYRHAPKLIQIILGLFLFIGGPVAIVYTVMRYNQSRENKAVMEAWKKFEDAAKVGEAEKMETALDEILVIKPTEPTALMRKKTMQTGEADINDKPMIRLSMRQNLRANKIPEAVREAEKWLKFEPKDWLSHCLKVMAALQKNDRALAIAELEALPDPGDQRAFVDPGSLLMAFRLFRILERDPTSLRNFVHNRLAPIMKSPALQKLPLVDRVNMVQCYLESFEPLSDKPQPQSLLEAWATVDKMIDTGTEEAVEAAELPMLLRLGRMCTQLTSAIAIFQKTQQMTEGQVRDYNTGLQENLEKIWMAVRKLDSKNPEAYKGLALLKINTGDYNAARSEVIAGLQVCENDADLTQLFSRMLQLEGRALEACMSLLQMAQKEPTNAVWWALAADAGIAASRRDLALQACQGMRKNLPDNRWAARTEAKLWIDAGDANKAVQLLHPFGLKDISRDTELARVYVRSLSAAGLTSQIEPFLAEAEKLADQVNSPVGLVAVLQGWLDAKPDGVQAGKIVLLAQNYTARWQESGEMFRIRAEALYRIAELTTPPFDSVKSGAAIQALERSRSFNPLDRRLSTMMGTCRVYGEKKYDQAYRDVMPLRDAESDPALTVEEMELLGTIYRLTARLEDAVRILERSTRSQSVTAGCYIQLALSYHSLRRKPEALAALRQAQSRPRNTQEQADYVSAARDLQREIP
jgi:tetratricopeptide (TPR) repeat protein